jgi:uncharacterized protein YprB with RNaseH-like and TPR domain
MASDLRTRLQRLKLQKLRRAIPPSVPVQALQPRPARPPRLEAAEGLPGERVVTPLGAFQRIETIYELDFQHGPKRLADLLTHDPAVAARLARDDKLAAADLAGLAFLDTETTGLAGGAGTLAFLVGVGLCDGDHFVLRQYFLLDPSHEEALLTALVSDLQARVGWITYNGRAFDLPLLESRLTINRQRGALGQRPHLDLLMPTRRLYRGRLPSCSLGEVERGVFKIIRDQDDVPGYLIPQMYVDYLRTGNPSEMRRVIYHNTIDILSMVTLAAHLMDVFATPLGAATPRPALHAHTAKPTAAPAPEDLLRLGCWHADNDRPAEAEVAFKDALAGRLALEDRRLALTRLAALLKRQGRRLEAVPAWEQLASFTLDDPEAFVELAKFYEWQARDLAQAAAWTDRALSLVAGWPANWQREAALTELRRRQERLRSKQLEPRQRANRPE